MKCLAGYYVASCQAKSLLTSATIENMTLFMNNELTVGIQDCPDIKCGFIGEIGTSWPLHGFFQTPSFHIFNS